MALMRPGPAEDLRRDVDLADVVDQPPQVDPHDLGLIQPQVLGDGAGEFRHPLHVAGGVGVALFDGERHHADGVDQGGLQPLHVALVLLAGLQHAEPEGEVVRQLLQQGELAVVEAVTQGGEDHQPAVGGLWKCSGRVAAVT
jgi:hypothetical protein